MSCLYQSLVQLWVPVYEGGEGLRRDPDVLVVALVVLATTTLAYLYYRWWSRHPLYGQNKGSKVYPFVGSVISFLRNVHRHLEWNTEILIKLPGHTLRRVFPGGTTIFVTANPANVEYMLKTNFENYPKGELFHGRLQALLGDGIFNADGHLWKIQRKVASHEFTTHSLRDFALQSTERETCDRLLPVLSRASQSGQVLDLQDIFARFAFDGICRLGFGVDPACLDVPLPHVKFAVAFDKATMLTVKHVQAFPVTLWNIQRALDIGRPKELRLAVEVIDEFAMGVIKHRRQELALASASVDKEPLGGKSDLLSRFMALVDTVEQGEGDNNIRRTSEHQRKSSEDSKSRSSNKFSDVFLRDMITSFVLAGRDTSTIALSCFFWLLSDHPNVESAILEEISRVLSSRSPLEGEGEGVGRGEHNTNKSSAFSFEELKSMQYLHAALTECMRLYPPVPADSKRARKADVWPDGTIIDANATVIYHPWAMGRLEDLWGMDCLEFRPERWLKDGVFVPQSPYKYAVFQAGPRVCLGKDMVMFQMKFVCVAILSNFQLSVPKDYKVQCTTSLTLRLKDGLPVTVKSRKIAISPPRRRPE